LVLKKSKEVSVLLLSPRERDLGYEYINSLRENLGLGYLAAVLEENGFKFLVYQNLDRGGVPGIYAELNDTDCVAVSLPFWENRKEYVGFLNDISGLLKPGVPLVLGGHAPTIGAEYFFRSVPRTTDIILGYAENAFVEYCRVLSGQGGSGLIIETLGPKRRLLRSKTPPDITKLPFPKRTLGAEERTAHGSVVEAYISASRGCLNNCTFCSVPTFCRNAYGGKYWEGRTAFNIGEEITSLLDSMPGLNYFTFVDDNFVGYGRGKYVRLKQIARTVKAITSGEIPFEITIRTDGFNAEVFEQLKEAGLISVYLGIESANQRILNEFKKGIKTETNLRTLRGLRSLGLNVDVGFIMYAPSATLDEIGVNLNFLKYLINDLGLTVHPGAILRLLRVYPQDYGKHALDVESDIPALSGPVSIVASAIDTIWRGRLLEYFVRSETAIYGKTRESDDGDPAKGQYVNSVSNYLISATETLITEVRKGIIELGSLLDKILEPKLS